MDALFDNKSIKLDIRYKKKLYESYEIQGIMPSGRWDTYLANTLIMLVQWCTALDKTIDTFQGLISGDDSSMFVEPEKLRPLLKFINRNYMAEQPAVETNYGLG